MELRFEPKIAHNMRSTIRKASVVPKNTAMNISGGGPALQEKEWLAR
jgi:hypothetical protein